jgi:hypothetical protein
LQIIYILVAALMLFAVWRMFRDRHGVIERPVRDPDFDESEGQPEVHEALGLLREGDWVGLRRLYGRLTPSDRYHLIDSLGRMAPSMPDLPDDPDSVQLTIAGGMRLVHGMKLEGKGPVKAVARANFERMRQAVSQADRELREASSRDPHDSTSLALQILAELGGLRDDARVNNLVGRLQASGEHNIYAAVNHLLANLPYIRRSADPMWRVANEWANARPNPAWLAIPARAHIEEWSYALQFPTGSSERETMIALMQDDDFRRHLAALDDTFWNALSREAISGAEHAFAHNHFAFLMHIFRVDDRAGRHLEQIGQDISRYPWCLLPTGATHPSRLLADLRKQYGLT